MGELAALASSLSWALASIFFTSLASKLDAVATNAFRCLISTLFFAILLPFAGGWEALRILPLSTIAILAISVTLIIAIGDTVYLKATRTIGVSRTMPIAGTNPLITTALAVTFLGERLTIWQIFGIALTVSGLILFVGPGRRRSKAEPPASMLGISLAIITSICWGLGTVLLKVGVADANAVVANCIRQPVALFFLLGLMAFRRQGVSDYKRLDRRTWQLFLIACLLGSGIASMLFVIGLQLTGAARGGVLSATAPVFGVPLSMILLKERRTPQEILGILVTIVGIILVV